MGLMQAGAGGIRPRGEAVPLAPGRLTDDQRKALKRVEQLVQRASALESHDNGQTETFLTHLDLERWSNVFLIDGGRGSGKTTVLLTLLQAMVAEWQDGQGAADRVLVPLELLELHSVGRSSNLMLQVASRFWKVVSLLGAQGASAEPAWFPSEAQAPAPGALSHWHAFVRAATTGWDGNVRERRANLDPEFFAHEQEQAERQRIAVPYAFRRLVDELLADLYRRFGAGHRQPGARRLAGATADARRLGRERYMFVIPVDDADLNPVMSIELLDLLRTLWHPRVAFLLTGDSDMFVTTLRAHFVSQLSRPSNGEVLSSELQRTLNLPSEAMRLADEIYRRVVPPSHRCKLPKLSGEQRLGHALGGGDGTRAGAATGSSAATATTMDAERAAIGGSIRDALREAEQALRERLGDAAGDARPLDAYFEAYGQARLALPERLRPLVDFSNWLGESGAEERYTSLRRWQAGVARYLLRQAIERSILSPAERHFVERTIGFGGDGEGPLFSNGAVAWCAALRELGGAIALDEGSLYQGSLVVRGYLSYEARLPGSQGEPGPPLHENVVGCLMLATDLAANDPSGPQFDGLSPPLIAGSPEFAAVPFESKALGRAVRCPWPLPAWPSFSDYFRFDRAWRDVVRGAQRGAQERDVAWLARAFVQLVLDVASSEGPLPAPALSPQALVAEPADWPSLAERLTALAQGEASKVLACDARWARREVALLAAPEAGLAPADADAFYLALDGSFKEQGISLHREALLAERRNRLRAAIARDSAGGRADDEAVKELSAEISRDDAWNDRVAKQPLKLRARRTLVQVLDAVLVERAEGGFFHENRLPLSSYLSQEYVDLLEVRKLPFGRALVEHANALAKVPDAKLVLASLWRRVLEQVRRLEWYPLVDPEQSHDFDRSWHRLTLAPLFKGEVQRRLWKLNDVSERIIAPPGEVEPAGALRLVEALYRLTWSITADLDDRAERPVGKATLQRSAGHTPTGGRWWYGATVDHAELPLGVPWLTVDWPALIDWENTRRTWNQLAPMAIARAGTEARSTPTLVTDALCLDFVVACAENIARRDPLVPTEGPSRDETLRRALGRRSLEERAGRRWDAYLHWRRDVPLLAAPESGVSAEFSDALLAANAKREGLPPTSMERLREARLERLRDALPTDEHKTKSKRDEAARRLAKEFDEEAGADHPWVRLVERG